MMWKYEPYDNQDNGLHECSSSLWHTTGDFVAANDNAISSSLTLWERKMGQFLNKDTAHSLEQEKVLALRTQPAVDESADDTRTTVLTKHN